MENNISELTKIAAENLHILLIRISEHITKLEKENAELRKKIQNDSE